MDDDLYRLKEVVSNNRRFPIVLQNVNGPCPLLAICNALLFRGSLKISADYPTISGEQLVALLGEHLLREDNQPRFENEDFRRNFEQNLADVMQIMPTLLTGVDVNVTFTGVDRFEFTGALSVFDMMRIRLFHGWVVDAQDKETARALGNMGYNQLVEKIISLHEKVDEMKKDIGASQGLDPDDKSNFEELSKEALLLEQFLQDTSTQLTVHGLAELHIAMKEGEYAVFFRNNHFSTVTKNDGELFLLVTDQGYLRESSIVWEKFSQMDGDSMFYDARFRAFVPSKQTTDRWKDNISPRKEQNRTAPEGSSSPSVVGDTPVLDQTNTRAISQSSPANMIPSFSLMASDELLAQQLAQELATSSIMNDDELLALQLQKEEDDAVAARQAELDRQLAMRLHQEEQQHARGSMGSDTPSSGYRHPQQQEQLRAPANAQEQRRPIAQSAPQIGRQGAGPGQENKEDCSIL